MSNAVTRRSVERSVDEDGGEGSVVRTVGMVLIRAQRSVRGRSCGVGDEIEERR